MRHDIDRRNLLNDLRSKSQLPLVAFGLLHLARLCNRCDIELATCYVDLRSRIARPRRGRARPALAVFCDRCGKHVGQGRERDLPHARAARVLPWVADGRDPPPSDEDMPPASMAMLLGARLRYRVERDDVKSERNVRPVR